MMGSSARPAGRNGPSRHQETVLIYGHASPKMRQRSADRMEQYIKEVLWDQHEGKYDKGQIKAENKAESLETLWFQGSPWKGNHIRIDKQPMGANKDAWVQSKRFVFCVYLLGSCGPYCGGFVPVR